MTLSRNLILALTVTGVAALAASLAVRRHARRLEAAQHKTDLQTWESEGGSRVALGRSMQQVGAADHEVAPGTD